MTGSKKRRVAIGALLAALLALGAATRARALDAPVSPHALPEVGALMRFIDSLSGEYVLSGQQEFPGWTDEAKDVDFDFLLATTGRRPAVRGFDFLFYTHSPDGRAGQHSTERAIAWSRAGGIVAFCCHLFTDIGSPAGDPQFYVPGASNNASGTTFDIRQAVIDGTPENREFLAKLDLLATELKKLRAARVPVIWRPLHECSGGWFWWGAHGPAPFIAAWRILFDRFTRVHGLDNLIWCFNPTDSLANLQSWYPGDDVVDMVGLDFYPSPGAHPTFAADYRRLRAFKSGRKLVAMCENGAIPDPDQLFADGANWAYFCTWNGFENDAAQNAPDFVNRVFRHPKIVTLDALPALFNTRAFTIVASPAPQLVVAGAPLTLSVAAHDTGPLAYRWSKDGIALAGATSASFSVAAATATDAGAYTVAVTGANGTLTSAPAAVSVAATDTGRLVNLSVRANAGTGDQTLITGFALGGGTAPRTVLLRAVGPALAAFGVTDVLGDPTLQLNVTPPIANDNWESNVTGSAAALAAAFAQTGAFALPPGSKDAALLVPLTSGAYTATVAGHGTSSGAALAEVYDAASASGARLLNLSARSRVGDGATLIAGFVVAGDHRTVLVRAVGGPTLAGFGVAGPLPNPRLALYLGSAPIASNDDWAGGAVPVGTLQDIFAKTGAFALDPAARDAVLLLTLAPGNYSAQVTSTDPGSGVALVEIYEAR